MVLRYHRESQDVETLGDRLIKAHPYSGSVEFYESEVVGVVLFVVRGDGPEVFELAEEALDEIAVSV